MKAIGVFRVLAFSADSISILYKTTICLSNRLIANEAICAHGRLPVQASTFEPYLSSSLNLGTTQRRFSGHAVSRAPASVSTMIGGLIDVRLENGSMALQADGTCLASSGSTHVLATAVCNSSVAVEDEEGMMPLQVMQDD